jgi:succinoglycan biosynthesis protein ExoM
LLADLLMSLQHQRTDNLFTYSVVVADNDDTRSAESVVSSCRRRGSVQIEYRNEPNRNIALARNKAVQSAEGDFIAFIDDDEVASQSWLLTLYRALKAYNVDAVLGPIVPRYEVDPPDWVIKGRFLERPRYPTGTVLPWYRTRTGNVLLSRTVFNDGSTMFNPAFRHSEDQEFFKRVIARGRRVIWCDEAPVFEVQRAERFRIRYFLKRGLLRGNVSLRLQQHKVLTITKSLVALAIYTAALPLLAIIRRDLAITYLMKDCDHLGKLLAACRVDLQPYLT